MVIDYLETNDYRYELNLVEILIHTTIDELKVIDEVESNRLSKAFL